MSAGITVLLADDHHLVRTGFRRILDDDPSLCVVGEAASGAEAVVAARSLQPQVIVMDVSMPGMDGPTAVSQILKDQPQTAILMLSMYPDDAYIRKSMQAGARGYLLKNALDMDLTAAVKAVAGGATYLAPGLAQPAAHDRLTPREKQILALIAQGMLNKEIAAQLNLSVNTVAVHRANLMQALNIHRSAELVMYALRNGLVSLP